MKKIFLFLFAYAFVNILFSYSVFAALGTEVNQAKQNTSFLLSFFSTEMLLNIMFATLAITVTYIIAKFVNNKLTGYLERHYSSELSGREEMVGVINRTVNVSILIIGFSVTLGILGLDLGIFMGGIGFGIGYTLRTFLTNFIAGIMMVTQGFYHNGDLIEVGGKTGYIVRIHALFTSIEQFNGIVAYIPNIKFVEENVENYHTNDKRRVEVEVLVDYETDTTKAKQIALKVLDSFPNVLKAPEAEVIIDKLGDSGILVQVRFWIGSKDEYFHTKSNITETLNMAFAQSGIKIPFQQVTISNRK